MSAKKYRHYDPQPYYNRLNALKGQLPTEFQKLADSYNNHEITRPEFDNLKNKLMFLAKAERRNIIDELNLHINAAEVKYLNDLAEGGDIDRFTKTYEKAGELDNEKLSREYEKSLKIGDKTSMKAYAFAAAEKGAKTVLNDYQGRDQDWAATMQEYRSFYNNEASKEAKLNKMLGHESYQMNEPRLKVKPMQLGYVRVDGGNQPHYFDRLEVVR